MSALSLVLLAVLCVPVPLASNRPYAWFSLEVYTFCVLALWALGKACYRDLRKPAGSTSVILSFLAAWLAYVYLQTLEIPIALVNLLNPFASFIQSDLELINIDARNTLSIDPGATYNEFLKYGAYVSIFYLLISTVTTKDRLLWSVALIVLAGILESVFGIYSHLADYTIFPEEVARNELRAGTFVNPNHFSNLVTMIVSLVFGLITAMANYDGNRHPERTRYTGASLVPLLLLTGVAMVMISAIFTTGSEVALMLLALTYGLMLLIAYATKRKIRGEILLAPFVLASAAAVMVVVGFDQSTKELWTQSITGGERLLQNWLGLQLFADVWLTGVGAGNYEWAFTMYRNEYLRFVVYDHARNDYLETLIEQGLVGSAFLGLALAYMVREMYRGYQNRTDPLMCGIIFGCLMGVVYMLLHGLVDFNFRIPANAIYFFALCALGMAACRIDRRRRRSRSRRQEEEQVAENA